MQDHDDFDFEDSPGIPAPLPKGEHIVWQGSPDLWEIAKNAFHLRKIAIYFALIVGIQLISNLLGNTSAAGASLPLTLMLSVAGLAILGILAYLTSRVTIYTVTNKRILIRFGIALQMTINLPFSQIAAADVRVGKNGIGDIPLTLKDTKSVNYIVLWPHVRPWNFSKPQPMLRSIANVQEVARLIGEVATTESPTGTRAVTQTKSVSKGVSGASADAVLMKQEIV